MTRKLEIKTDRKGRPRFTRSFRFQRPTIASSDDEIDRFARQAASDELSDKLKKLDFLMNFYQVKTLFDLAFALAQDFVGGFGNPSSKKSQGAPRKSLRDPLFVAGMVLVAKNFNPDYTDQEACKLVACCQYPALASRHKLSLRRKLAHQLANLLPAGRELLEAEDRKARTAAVEKSI